MNPEITIAPLPHVAVQVFSETSQIRAVIEEASHDRRMAKAHLAIHTGGVAAAVEAFRDAPTPNIIVIETVSDSRLLLDKLDELAGFCDEGTRVVVIGHANDVHLYRELMRRGVSEYLVAPVSVVNFVRALSEIYTSKSGKPLGRVIAMIGAKGGVGSSTLAHNLAYTIARDMAAETAIVDMDLAYGTVGLNFNQDPAQGILDVALDAARVDAQMIDRLLSRCGDRLQLLAAPSSLDRLYDFQPDTFDPMIDAMRSSLPVIVLDIPHLWTGWARSALMRADEIVVVAEPDLASLRNAKNLIDTLSMARLNDHRPHLLMNKVGVPKRPEIAVAEFARALDCVPVGTVAFDPNHFGTAANNGQMLAELQPKSKVNETMTDLAKVLTGREVLKVPRKSLLAPLLDKWTSLRSGNAA